MKILFIYLFIIFYTTHIYAQNDLDSLKNYSIEEFVVYSTRATNKIPVSYNNILSKDLNKISAARNIPLLLETLPSFVSSTEDGLGVGYSSMRIRGTDATRINVTLNGMPLNNPESQGVYWVNLPNLANSIESVQVQRGVGVSTNGSSSFGASISLKTGKTNIDSYGESITSIGSYNTFCSSVSAGTGILANGLSFDIGYSRVIGDGYIRNGSVNQTNLHASISHTSKNQFITLNYINGIQHTGITWEGVTKDQIDKYGRRYNPAGEYFDDAGNKLYYTNETDNYYSNILQLIYFRELTNNLSLNFNFSYNNGYGYYENFKMDKDFKNDFGIQSQTVNNVLYEKSNVIIRQLLNNKFYFSNLFFKYQNKLLTLQYGSTFSLYDGDHYGELIWAKYNQNIPLNYKWYENNGNKIDITLFSKLEYAINRNLNLYVDLQGRFIKYKLFGVDDDFTNLSDNYNYNFFNPKSGIFYNLDESSSLYGSLSIANREPLREDLKESKKNKLRENIKSEKMIDYELGYKYSKESINFAINLYYMNYDNQIVQTGKLNDVGYALMENVKNSYRTGLEIETSFPIKKDKIILTANATFSRNKIKNYTAYYPVLNDNFEVVAYNTEKFNTTNICYSPNIIASATISYKPLSDLEFRFITKYVDKQYLDNTSNNNKMLSPYFFANLSISYMFKFFKWDGANLEFFVNNLFNKKYISNGYASTSYSYLNNNRSDYVGYYPQAIRNYMIRLSFKF